MANNFSNYLENALLGHTLLGSTYTSPATIWVSLATSLAADGATYSEVADGTAYARQVITFGAPSGNTVRNSNLVSFPEATTPWGTVAHFALHDAATAGNMLYHGDLGAAKTIGATESIKINISSLSVSLD